MQSQTKKCTKCGEVKELGEYYKKKSTKSGLDFWCKDCSKRNAIKWAKNNPEKDLARKKKWVEDNLERDRERKRLWALKNYDITKSRPAGMWAKNNPEKSNANARKYKSQNREKINSRANERQAITREKLSDVYLKVILIKQNLPVTPETIELKRDIIKFKRLKSKIKNYVTEKTNGTAK